MMNKDKDEFKRQSALAGIGCKLRMPHGEWVEVAEPRDEDDCEGCVFWVRHADILGVGCGDVCCVPSLRKDGRNVIFRITAAPRKSDE